MTLPSLPVELLRLAVALGVLKGDPESGAASGLEVNEDFFKDPAEQLSGVLRNPVRRAAALKLATALLGSAKSAALETEGAEPGRTWIPLPTGSGAGAGRLFLVVDESGDAVTLSLAARATLRVAEVECAASLVVPILGTGPEGTQFLPGTAEGDIRVAVNLQLPPAPGDFGLGRLRVGADVPTHSDSRPRLRLGLMGLRIPGRPPRDLDIDDGSLPDELGELIPLLTDLLTQLLRSRGAIDPDSADRMWLLLTLFGLGDTSVIPPLPLAELPASGPLVLADWVRAVFLPRPGQPVPPPAARAWLETLAELIGLSPELPVRGDGTKSSPYLLCVSPLPGVLVCVRLVAQAADDGLEFKLGLAAAAEWGEAVSAHASADLLAVRLGGGADVLWLPEVRVHVEVSGADGHLVRRPAPPEEAVLSVGTLSAGFSVGVDRDVRLLLEAVDVVLDGHPYARLDLSSVEALAEAAARMGVDALADALETLFSDDEDGGARRATALLVLLALREPTADWPVELPPLTEIVGDPAGALLRYHARVLAGAPGRWGAIAEQLTVLVRAPAPTGAGSAEDPWVVPVDGPGLPVRMSVLLWQDEAGASPRLTVGIRMDAAPLPVAGGAVRVSAALEAVRLTLPLAAPPSVVALIAAEVRLAWGDDLVFDAGPVRLKARSILLAGGWRQGAGWVAGARISGASVLVGEDEVALPDPLELATGAEPLPPGTGSELWPALTRLAGLALLRTTPPDGLDPREVMAALLGWLPARGRLRVPGEEDSGLDLGELLTDWPPLPLEGLVADPVDALRSWLGDVLAGAGGTDRSVAAVALVRELLSRGGPEQVREVAVAGDGTYDRPWRLPLGASRSEHASRNEPASGSDSASRREPASGPELLVWLDPDGPGLQGLGDVLDQLVPADLTAALDRTAPLPGIDRLTSVLAGAARFDDPLAELLDGRPDLASGLATLLENAAGSDGLLPSSAQVLSGATLATTAVPHGHLCAPETYKLTDHLPAADASRTVYVSSDLPGIRPWPGQPGAPGARLIDLRTPGLAAESFDLGGLAASGPWYVLLPPTQESTARLRRVVAELRRLAGAPVVLVAHSLAARPAAQVWSEGGLAHLVTLGGALSDTARPGPLDGLELPGVRDAFRLLQSLVDLLPAGLPASAAPLAELLATWAAVSGDAPAGRRSLPFPVSAFTPMAMPSQAPAPLLNVVTEFTLEELHGALTALVTEVAAQVRRRLPGGGAAQSRARATHLGLGLAFRTEATTAGGLTCRGELRLDAWRLALTTTQGQAARTTPRLRVRVTLRRPGGWLVEGPPQAGAQAGPPPRLRGAELLVAVGPRLADSSVSAVLHDAALDGVGHGRLAITPHTLDAAARRLLGLLADQLSPRPSAGPVRDLVDLLVRTDVAALTTDERVEIRPDALERVIADPAGLIRVVLSDPAVLDTLRRLTGLPDGGAESPSTGGLVVTVGPDGVITVSTPSRGLPLADVATLHGTLVTAPRRAPALTLGLRSGDAEAALLPEPDLPALARLLMLTTGGEFVRRALQSLRERGIVLDPLLDVLGLLAHDPRRPEAPSSVRSPVPLLTAPARQFAEVLGADRQPGEPFRLAPGRMVRLLDAVAQLIGVPGGLTVLPLPGRGSIGVAEVGADLEITLRLRDGAGPSALESAVRWRVRPGPVVTAWLTLSAERSGPDGFAVGLELEAGPEVRVSARLTPRAGAPRIDIPLYPQTPGLGALAELGEQAARYALPMLLDALRDLARPGEPGEPGGPVDPRLARIATALAELLSALGLTETDGSASTDQLKLLASAPADELGARFRRRPAEVTGALKGLARALIGDASEDPPVLWRSPGGRLVVDLDTAPGGEPRLTVSAGGLRPVPGTDAEVSFTATTAGLGPCHVSWSVVDPDALFPGPVDLMPFVRIALDGVEGRFETGLWLDPPATTDREALVVRVPGSPLLVHRRGGDDSADVAGAVPKLMRRVAVPLAADLALTPDPVTELLKTPVGSETVGEILHTAQVLSGTGSPPGAPWRLADGLLDTPTPRVLSALAGFLLAVTPRLGPVRLSVLRAEEGQGASRYGLGLELVETPYPLLELGDVVIALSADGSWEPPAAGAGSAHVELWLASLPDALPGPDPRFSPALRVRGLGFTAGGAKGPLLDQGLRIDALELHGSYAHDTAGFRHAGARLALKGMAVPLGSAGGGTNPVAAKILQPDAAGGDATPAAPGFHPALALWKQGQEAVTLRLSAGEGSGPWWLVVEKQLGPIHLAQVGLDITYEGEEPRKVGVLVDGGVALGGLAVDVDDLGLYIPWATPADPRTWSLGLAGLAVSYDGPSVKVAGGLRKRERDGGVEYAGMLKVEAAGFGLTAVGAYGTYPVAGSAERYTSMFGIAAIAAPIGGPPAFFITGIGAGLGLNRGLELPAKVTDVGQFPLVAAMDPGSEVVREPMKALDSMGRTFPPRRGAFWLAAGVRFTSFTVVESVAVLAVAFDKDVEVVLLGLSRMGLPNPAEPIASIELALRARFSTREALLSVEAQLTDNSWLLSRDCRLSGGFAMVIWFRTGEFLLSLGGYHPRFAKPAHYPDVPRLGIHWRVSEAIAIKGESYFTLTSSCVMAGARVEAAFDGGFVQASFAAGLDALVSWDPFFYDVGVFVRVSARLEIDIRVWFVHIRITIGFSLSAELIVQGPDLRGVALLDLDVAKVEVAFGAVGTPDSPPPLGWAAFHDKYLVAGDPHGETMSLTVRAGGVALDPGSPSGTPEDGSLAHPLRLTSEFTLVSTTRTASNRAGDAVLGGAALDLGPMKHLDVVSEHRVEMVRLDAGGTPVGTAVALATTPVRGNVPDGVWRCFDDVELDEGGVREAFTGLVLAAVTRLGGGLATGTVDEVEPGVRKSLPLSEDRDPAGAWSAAMEAAVRWSRAQSGSDTLARTAEFLARGAGLAAFGRCLRGSPNRPSGFALALLAADRISPPRLSRVTEGLVAPVLPPLQLVPRRPPQKPDPQPPYVAPPVLLASLRPPVGPVRRDGRTTVRTREWPRRAAPTLAEARVQALPTAARLHTVPALADAVATTGATARDRGRRFSRGGEEREVLRGLLSVDHSAPWLRSGQRDIVDGTVQLGAGQVQVWRLLRAADDVRTERPRLALTGDQRVRVVALDRAGAALLDAEVAATTELPVPRGAHILALIGLGTTPAANRPRRAGLSGWHPSTFGAQVRPGTVLVPGARVNTHAPGAKRGLRPARVALVTGGELVGRQGLITTELPASTRCVVLVVSAAEPVKDTDGLLLGLDGAQRVRGATEPTPPLAVEQGGQSLLLYPVTPTGGTSVSVTTGYDERWCPAGVLGSAQPAERVARAILRYGLPALAGDLAGEGSGQSAVTWIGVAR
ncbi:DUF6603 domain-containing protein [Streptomyces sp. NPDC041068]|uniref:DUF6603 domain-containing protein n=1 Tax=Streptomyces sp. NPDC041068 TaxID=3155130 RepID=UPI0033FD6C12